jgi:hypothetical protein
MVKFIILNISLIVKHSAKENDDALFGLFFPLIILIFWVTMGNPLKKWKEDTLNDSLFSFRYRFSYFFAFIMICLMTIIGVYRGIRYFWLI